MNHKHTEIMAIVETMTAAEIKELAQLIVDYAYARILADRVTRVLKSKKLEHMRAYSRKLKFEGR